MNELFLDLGISAILTLLKKIAKKEEDKRKWRNVMLKIASGINIAYASDETFQSDVVAKTKQSK